MKKINKKQVKPSSILIFLSLCLLTLTFLYPLFFMIINSLKTKAEYYASKFSFPAELQFINYQIIIQNHEFLKFFKNSLIISVISVILVLGVAIFASYAFAKIRFRGKSIIYMIILATMFIPGQVTMVPTYVMFSKMQLIDTHLVVILSYLTGVPGAILLLTGTFTSISNELIESIKIDGAGYFDTIRHVIIPLGMPGIAINVIFNFIGYWNDLMTPLIYLSTYEKKTLMVMLSNLTARTGNQPTHQMAGFFLSLIPVIVIYLFCQRYLMKGLTMGALKG